MAEMKLLTSRELDAISKRMECYAPSVRDDLQRLIFEVKRLQQVEADAEQWCVGAVKQHRDERLQVRIKEVERECDQAQAKVKQLQKEIDRLREGEECHVARPGEGTYECDGQHPCPACRLRLAEAEVERLRAGNAPTSLDDLEE